MPTPISFNTVTRRTAIDGDAMNGTPQSDNDPPDLRHDPRVNAVSRLLNMTALKFWMWPTNGANADAGRYPQNLLVAAACPHCL